MSRDLVAHNRPVFDQLHPKVYGAAVSLVALFAISAWVFFDRQSDIDLSLVMVTVLPLVAVLVPWLLFLVWRKYLGPHDGHRLSFRDWTSGDFAVWGPGFTAHMPQSMRCCRLRPWPSVSWRSGLSS
jgi:hypothetical protein